MAARESLTLLPEPMREALTESGFRPRDVTALAGDVSLRRYYRLRLDGDQTIILALYPDELAASCERFARTSRLLADGGVRVPEVLESHCGVGMMLVEDLGEKTLFDLRHQSWDALVPYLRRASELGVSVSSISTTAVRELNPPLDQELLGSELNRSWNLLLEADGAAPESLSTSLASAFDELIVALTAAPQVACHRDFMARNLVPVGEPPDLAVIDHQDLRLGPATYDLASLLNDSLYPPEEIEMSIVTAALKSPEELLDYHRAASQRTLKAVGTFVAFSRRGDDRHRVLVQPTLERARHHLLQLPEMESVKGEIDELWTALLHHSSAV